MGEERTYAIGELAAMAGTTAWTLYGDAAIDGVNARILPLAPPSARR